MKTTDSDLSPWRDPDELLAVIGRLGVDPKPELCDALAHLLDHGDPDVREEVIRKLVIQWNDITCRTQIVRILRFDESNDVRSAAAYGLAGLSSESTRIEDTELLLAILEDSSEDESLRGAAYEALLLMYGGKGFPPVTREVDLVNDVNWPWVATLRDELGRGPRGDG